MLTRSPNKQKNFKQTLSARKRMATVFCDRKGVLMVEFLQKWTTINIRSVLRNTKKKAYGHAEQKAWNADIWCSAPP
jgi:hypothetical protein